MANVVLTVDNTRIKHYSRRVFKYTCRNFASSIFSLRRLWYPIRIFQTYSITFKRTSRTRSVEHESLTICRIVNTLRFVVQRRVSDPYFLLTFRRQRNTFTRYFGISAKRPIKRINDARRFVSKLAGIFRLPTVQDGKWFARLN